MSLTSEEVNFLIYRYLLESGFIHSAFAFGHESLIVKSSIDGTKVVNGALISFIQKGLQFVEIEAHVNGDGTETICDGAFSAVEPHSCNIKSKKRIFDPHAADSMEDHTFGQQEATSDDVSYLRGHGSIVCSCSWHPSKSLLASGSGDATVRFWSSPMKSTRNHDEHVDKKAKTGDDNVVVATMPSTKETVRDGNRPSDSMVVSLEWNASGTAIVTGSYDGKAHTWTADGRLLQSFDHHKAPLSAVKWSPGGDKLLTACVDKSAALWNSQTGTAERHYAFHQAPITDIDWKDNTTFAMCSMDRTISIWSTKDQSDKSNVPKAKLEGHAADINMIRWAPGSDVLASCSDDSLVKLWSPESKSCQDLPQHTREVCAIEWGSRTQLASGSLDATVRVWDTESMKCSHTFTKHLHPVSSIAYSPDRSLLASASHDRMYVWSLKEDTLVKTFRADGGINDLSWDHSGHRLAGGCTNNDICIVDIRS
uniref:Uncharacterized protein n=1 Tax=Lotharella oceanica TaxID=641309 RepID=A0A7S2TH01_9EUKA|mmetsp:Transcript_11749/g.22624  ORF Transcript_11749/g.22624 Transcript_11749/m.22624 type:complete len:481 (+) Transcript_11749:48-1490(+)